MLLYDEFVRLTLLQYLLRKIFLNFNKLTTLCLKLIAYYKNYFS